jgi:hypothetical protein
MKVMNKIAFSFVLLFTLCCCTKQQQTPKVLDQKKVTFRYFSINQLTTSNGWVEHQMLQEFWTNYDFNYKKR